MMSDANFFPTQGGPALIRGSVLSNRRGYFWQIHLILVNESLETVFDSATAGYYFSDAKEAEACLKDCCREMREKFNDFLREIKPIFTPVNIDPHPTIH